MRPAASGAFRRQPVTPHKTPTQTMNASAIEQAAHILWSNWRSQQRIAALPDDCRPAERAEGYEVQAALARLARVSLSGWKIAATSTAGQQHIGVDGPLAGRLLAERQIADGADFVLGSNLMKVAEMEFAFRMGEDLAPRATPYTQAEVLGAVSALHPAIELPDSRYRQFEKVGALQLIADNACAHLFVLGPATSAAWRAIDLIEERPVTTMRSQQYVGHGKNVLGDPRAALAWLANELRGLGITLRAGEVVTTGTCHPPLPIQAGDKVEADFGVLGKVSVRFS